MTPREIIEQTLEKSFYALTYGELAAEIEAALQSQGYRIVEPGLDADTSRHVAHLKSILDDGGLFRGEEEALRFAIRALGEKP